MEKDVVCGMQVDPAKAAGTSQCNGKTYTSARRAARPSSTPIPFSTRNEAASWCVSGHFGRKRHRIAL